ncbi:serine/threonine protein phosphatase [Deinococcus aquiradiocola]|uniref:Serine/threonine protein phosphatase n=1 Tax=Deinococcus aquiradiocola TaxID=393059 RepID=A0A917PBD4_9DEIO|nr:serine/threonine protein phosphatase [Deinococcus aquiradiocola]
MARVTVYVIGDTHGCLTALDTLLQAEGLTDRDHRWTGGTDELWFLGDYTDRGPDGVGVIERVMDLQAQAQTAGGRVGALLGNHDVILLNAQDLPEETVPDLTIAGQPWTFRQLWQDHAGGQASDAAHLTPEHLTWLRARPLLARVGDTLLMHADTTMYLDLGDTPDEINAAGHALLHSRDATLRGTFEANFARRQEFMPDVLPDDEAEANLQAMLGASGCTRLVHGHTPVFLLHGQPAANVTEPYVYAQGRCTDVDAALFAGGPGFTLRLP